MWIGIDYFKLFYKPRRSEGRNPLNCGAGRRNDPRVRRLGPRNRTTRLLILCFRDFPAVSCWNFFRLCVVTFRVFNRKATLGAVSLSIRCANRPLGAEVKVSSRLAFSRPMVSPVSKAGWSTMSDSSGSLPLTRT